MKKAQAEQQARKAGLPSPDADASTALVPFTDEEAAGHVAAAKAKGAKSIVTCPRCNLKSSEPCIYFFEVKDFLWGHKYVRTTAVT